MGLSTKQKLRSLVKVCLGATAVYSGISVIKGDEHFYKSYVMPLVHLLDPEQAHKLAVFTSKHRLLPKSQYIDPPILKISLFGKDFSNPIGIAAGFDKDGSAILGLRDLGFGFVEIGSVTPLPQPGNEKPRVFRLPEEMAIINRYGFNSEGHATVLERVHKAQVSQDFPIVGVNLGKNKTSQDAVRDYVEGIKVFGEVSDYLVINVSSPNTPNLRKLQNKESLRKLLPALVAAKNALNREPKPSLFLKLAPDLSFEEKKDIADIIIAKDCKVDGLIICNTTIERSTVKSKYKDEPGGLSGVPLKDASTQMIKEMSKLTNGAFIIGVGGVSSGKDAYDKIRAGASLVQVYSALIYGGPPLVAKIKKELADLLEKDGCKSVCDAVGKDVR